MEAATTSLKDTSLVVREENDVSRQVDKPIYPEEVDKHSPLTHNLSTAISCGTVRAGYTVSALVEDKPKVSLPISLIPCDPSTCFNKFLHYHKLPLLPSPQTINSFLLHLIQHSLWNNLQNELIISIKSDYSEAHIYTPEELCPLPDHEIVPYQSAIFANPHIPLKSSIQPSTQLSTTPNLSKPHDLHLTIATHNVRGFNVASKRQAWQDYCVNHNISIASITETKISHNKKLSFCNNNLYTYYWANSDSSIEGTAIMIRNHLKPHVHSCYTHSGGAIALDLFFKSNIKLRIISVYLSSTDSTRRNLTQNTVINWILQAQQLNLQPIILGDFNTHESIFSSSAKYKLINFLHRSNMFDIGAHLNNTHHTWSNNSSSSRIDYIWTNSFNIQFLLSFEIDNSKSSTLSDHFILTTSWTFPNAYSKPPRLHTNISRRIFDYKSTTNDQWTEFAELTSNLVSQHNIPLTTQTQESIDTTWHKLQYCITQAAIQIIPNKITRKRSYNHKYSPQCTALHLGLKKLGHLIKILNNCNKSPQPHLSYINSHILTINSYAKCNLQSVTSLDSLSIQTWLQHAYTIWKQIYHAYHLEHSLRLRHQINQASEKRCETLVSKPTQAINSILNRYQPPVHFTNIKLSNQLITDPTQIKQHIRSHFSNWTAFKPINQQLFDNFWQQHYLPLPHINPDWYIPLTASITTDEVLQTISKLPNGKACGPTGISYEMIKHLGNNCILALTALFNRCLSQNNIPKLWKHGRIYPIPKTNSFDGNLNLTRPISLIEHARKIYTKILTNRLNQTFSQHPILSPFNYVALPGNSTSIPIHILNNLIEDANCNYKELWLLSQDMSKAYDSVNFSLFKHSLSRLSLPQSIINILSDLLVNRQNEVITNFGLTSPYQVQNGIDQGETITPLLWRIYYDPLISYIHSNFSGYSASTTWLTNLKNSSTKQLHTNCSVLAYMDDTLWVASSQAELVNILTIAESFYTMANIKVNPTKSILSTNSKPSTYNTIIFNSEPLALWPSNQPFKFLGCWFTLDNKSTKQSQLISLESSQLIRIANKKQITDSQARYIINIVIIPTLEYRLQNIVLSQSTCDKIFKQHINLLKHKAKLCRTIPTSVLLHPYIYNIKNIWDIQLQHHIPNFIKRLNNNHLLGILTQIRVQQLQNNLWSTTSILSHPCPIIDGPNRFTTNFKIIQLLKHLEWEISPSPNTPIPFLIQEGSITLESILSSHPNYSTFKKQLRHHHILFLDQLTTSNNIHLLNWKHISPRLNKIPKGKIPQWFKILENLVTDSSDSRTISSQLNMPPTNYYSYSTGYFYKHSKPWLITLLNNQILIGKARRQSTNSGYTLITHWQHNLTTNHLSFYPLPDIITQPCLDCHLNSRLINNKCTILIPTSNAAKFHGRLNSDKSINFNANPLDLIYSIQIKTFANIPTPPNLNIQTSQIPPIFFAGPASDILQTFANHNYNSTHLVFYTDGSVVNPQTTQCTMGIGWLQTNNNQIIHTFQAQILLWPCSFKAELLAILSAICTAPRNCNIEIFTDSQSVISKYYSLTQYTAISSSLNTPYWSIWNTFLNFIQSYNLNITFHKVKAHQNDELNNKADQLAHNHTNSPFLILNPYNLYNPLYTITSNNYPLELPIRRSIRTINHANILALWSSQNRFQPWIQISQHINWNATWLYINNNQKVSNFAHSFQSSTLKTFRIKLLTDELPTPHTLHRRNYLYPNICHICQQTSSILHWTICPDSNLLFDLIQNSLQLTITPSKLQNSLSNTNQLHSLILNLDSLQTHQLPDKPSIFSTLSGLIPFDIIYTIREFTSSNQIATTLCIQFLLHLNKQIYTNIWIPYCCSRSQSQTIQPQQSFISAQSTSLITNIPNTTLQTSCTKFKLWYTNWFKSRIHPSHILNLSQI